MELTAKEILEKHLETGLSQLNWKQKVDVLAAIKEACQLSWSASWKRFRQEEYAKEVTAPDKDEFINSLFPESK